MNNIDCLLEKWLTGVRVRDHIEEIFVNPTPQEFREAIRTSGYMELRFIADNKNNNLYIWRGDVMMHTLAWDKIKEQTKDTREFLYKSKDLFPGTYNDRLKLVESFGASFQIEDYASQDWKWVDKWFKLQDFINRRSEEEKKHQGAK